MNSTGYTARKKGYMKNSGKEKAGYSMEDPFEMCVEKDAVVLKKTINKCALCSNTDDIISFKEKHICKNCVTKLKNNMF